jgi:hypothetical protein
MVFADMFLIFPRAFCISRYDGEDRCPSPVSHRAPPRVWEVWAKPCSKAQQSLPPSVPDVGFEQSPQLQGGLAVEPQLTALAILCLLTKQHPDQYGRRQHSIVLRLLGHYRPTRAADHLTRAAGPPPGTVHRHLTRRRQTAEDTRDMTDNLTSAVQFHDGATTEYVSHLPSWIA